ncbi:TetR/AcrR family transcriptional regulator [Embleya sp. NBC_00896]|uniref:TetR/AcrR family transcriptional regulator n=1 Tax=Embleya sp. NBC_00896 TaxID=2975961 RepID=UPI00386A913E|nr:TetR/AcrR family transcriptional regulator [Embleya sp. NBC_00896]
MDDHGSNRRRNRRGQGALLREDILAAATALIEHDGHAGELTLRRIAREAEITAPSIYAHFNDLADILDTVLNGYFDDLRDTIAAATGSDTEPDRALLAGCRAYARFAMERPGRYRALFNRMRSPANTDPDRPELPVPPRRADVFQALVDAVEATATAGLSVSEDPYEDALAVWAAMHGAVLLRMSIANFGWPDLPEFVDTLVTRTARLTR